MSQVEFEDKISNTNSFYKSRRIFGDPQTPDMVLLVMRVFHFKNEKNAGVFLFAIAGFFAVLALYFSFTIFWKPSTGKIYTNPYFSQTETYPSSKTK